MHAQLYKSFNLTPEERARMAEVWRNWEERKRQLDGEMNSARDLLSSLPTHISLPREFLSHLNALLTTPSACGQSQAARLTAPLKQNMSQSLSTFCSSRTDNCDHQQHFSLRTHSSQDSYSSFDTVFDNSPQASVSMINCMHTSVAVRSATRANYRTQQSTPQPEVRFMGQHVSDMVRAERALRDLRRIQHQEIDIYTYILDAEMPGSLLGLDKHHMIWSDYFMSQKMLPDYIELCQIAAIERNRGRLFADPF
jgi:hypothetical protein